MIRWFVAAVLLATTGAHAEHASKNRTLRLDETRIGVVRTALGYSTLVQFDSRPSSVILGDQDAFKVEQVGNALAIKPLVRGAKSNLFAMTEGGRFNFRLVTGAAEDVDFTVRVTTRATAAKPLVVGGTASDTLAERWIDKTASQHGVTLTVEALAWPNSLSCLVIRFYVKVTNPGTPVRLEPGDISLSERRREIPVDALYLDRLNLDEAHPLLRGTLIARQRDIGAARTLRLTFAPDSLLGKSPRYLRVSFPRFSLRP